MSEIDFAKIAPRGGSVENAFEELCCQLASKTRPPGIKFERYRGAGGDGGVECILVDADGAATGWQAKYVFNIDSLLAQAGKSLTTALSVHPDLKHYVICFPFDLTGKTSRKGKSQTEKFDDWACEKVVDAKSIGRDLTIERRSANDLLGLMLASDPSGGLRQYFFFEKIFSEKWFSDHITAATLAAGPRYNREISLETPLSRWFASFEGEKHWATEFALHLNTCRKEAADLEGLTVTKKKDSALPGWPDGAIGIGREMAAESIAIISIAGAIAVAPLEEDLSMLQSRVIRHLEALAALESKLAADIDTKHGAGSANSKRFRSFMAEYNVSFPAANLDAVRDLREKWSTFLEWLESPEGFLAFRNVFVLSGAGGAGKTHSICDVAQGRLASGSYTCIVFGHQFGGEPDPWTRFAETLGVPLTLGRDGVLDALDAAAECSGKKLFICIDAVNETIPRNYWFNRFAEFARAIAMRANLKICVSCRSSFLQASLPRVFAEQEVEHLGFAGMEREACNGFFTYYGLEPPLVPVLQPELANPLYLKLVCETLRAKGIKQLPKGWYGIAPVIRAFLAHKEEQFAIEHGVSAGAAIVSGSLRSISAAIAAAGSTALRWSDAQSIVDVAKPHAKAINVLQWLVTADLLIEDGPSSDGIGAENVVRPAFERFGDFLIAAEMLAPLVGSNVSKAFQNDGKFAYILNSAQAVIDNAGVLSALSVLLPEKMPDVELIHFVEDVDIRKEVRLLVVGSLPWRTGESLVGATQGVLRDMLNIDAYVAFDAMLAVSTQASQVDALWLDEVLSWLPFSNRDAVWCGYLKMGYEENSIVRRIIEAARDIDVKRVDEVTALRWCIVLIWFTASADRRVKDSATRAAVTILRAHTALLRKLVKQFILVDDDEVRERTLLISYSALILSPDKIVMKVLAEDLLLAYAERPDAFQNAMIRDHIRCIAELAALFGCLDRKFDPQAPNLRNPKVSPPKDLDEGQGDRWDKEKDPGVRLLVRSCLDDDFNHYSIGCLRGWEDSMNKTAVGKWIAKRILEDFSYQSSKCGGYDSSVANETGGGRGKPAWAERIGKKYQWVAMYQLASRLFDSVDREKDPYERTTSRLPLILNEERKMDPTIARPEIGDRKPSDCWWVGGSIDLPATASHDLADWIKDRDDIPSMESLLAVKNHQGQDWLPLVCYPSWSEYRSDRPYGELYRSTWMHLEAYLVPDAQFDSAIRALSGRNFFGNWMPSGAKWLHVFLGEYPWATACNVETDDWLGFDSTTDGSDLEFVPVFNEVNCEWEYDGTLKGSLLFHVPARKFFEVGDLWWDGLDGFANPDGRSVFRDPSASEGGSSTLVADINDLIPRLNKLNIRLIWTLLGEKQIVGDKASRGSQVTYSQTAYLNEDGSVTVGDRVFFKDYRKNSGLAPKAVI